MMSNTRATNLPLTPGASRGRPPGSRFWGRAALYAFLLLCLLVTAYPLVWLFYSSFKPQKEIFENAFALPRALNITNYVHIWSSSSFPRYYLNSMLVSFVSVLGVLAFSTTAGYVFARLHFRGRNALFYFLVLGMMVPFQVTLVPNFVLLKDVNLLDTYAAMILPYIAFQLPVSVFIMRGFFHELPVEMEDAACIDGCGKKQIFFRVMLPLSKPAVSTIVIYKLLRRMERADLRADIHELAEVPHNPRGNHGLRRPVRDRLWIHLRGAFVGEHPAAHRLLLRAEADHQGAHRRRDQGIG